VVRVNALSFHQCFDIEGSVLDQMKEDLSEGTEVRLDKRPLIGTNTHSDGSRIFVMNKLRRFLISFTVYYSFSKHWMFTV